jgi:hypothetical protein
LGIQIQLVSDIRYEAALGVMRKKFASPRQAIATWEDKRVVGLSSARDLEHLIRRALRVIASRRRPGSETAA